MLRVIPGIRTLELDHLTDIFASISRIEIILNKAHNSENKAHDQQTFNPHTLLIIRLTYDLTFERLRFPCCSP